MLIRVVHGFAIIRFLPAIEAEEIPYVKMYNHGFKIGSKWFIENCPTTLGQDCPICTANSELWNTGTQANQDIARKRKRKLRYYSNIMVLSDAKRPQNEGKIFLFSYGVKIFAKLMNAIEPEFEDEKSFNPFDFWEGASFKLKIRDDKGFRSYDKSDFGDCEPLFKKDEAMEEVWKNEYPLQELVAPNQFKSYDELKKRFIATISAPVVNAEVESTNEKRQNELNTGDDFNKRTATVTKAAEPSTDDDDDYAMFQSLIDS